MSSQSPECVLIVDFGSQVTQLIARRVREAGVYSEIAPFGSAAEALRAAQAQGRDPVGRAGLGARRGAARAFPTRSSTAALPMLGICYGQQALMQPARRRGQRRATAASSAAPSSRSPKAARCSTACGREGESHQVWMSHGDKVTRLAPGFRPVAASPGAPFAVIADDARRIYAHAVPPRGRPHARRRQAARRTSSATSAAWPATGRWPSSARPRSTRSAIRSATGRVICGLSGGVDQRGRRGADPRGDRRAADLRLRRSRPDAAGRGRAGGLAVPRPLQHPAGPRRCRDAVPQGARGRHRSRGQAQVHRQDLHRRVRGRGAQDRRRRIPRAGHALSRRDRKRLSSPAGPR